MAAVRINAFMKSDVYAICTVAITMQSETYNNAINYSNSEVFGCILRCRISANKIVVEPLTRWPLQFYDGGTGDGQTMLATDRCAPHELHSVLSLFSCTRLDCIQAATALMHLVHADRNVSTCDGEQEP